MANPPGVQDRKLLLRGIYLNYLQLLVGFGSVMVLTPVILAYIGQSAYGLWAIFNSIVTYFTLLDFGMNTAAAKYTAEYLAKDQRERGSRIVSTIFVLVAVIGIVIAATCAALRTVVPWLFNVPVELQSTAQVVFLLTGLNVAVMLVGGVFGNVIFGLQRVDIWKACSIVQIVANSTLTVLLLYFGCGLIGVVSASLLSSMLVILLYLLFLHRAENAVAIDPKLVDMGVFKEIAPYSLRTFFLGMSSRVLYYTDYIVIGLFLSAAQVTPYEIAYKLCFLSTYAFSVISTSMFPKFSRLYALGELEELRSLYVAIAKGSLLIMAPIGIGLAFLGEPFIALWVGSEHIVEHQVLLVLILMNVFHAIGTPACMVLQSCGRNKELMYSELLNAMLNVMLSVFLVQRLGVLGVAVGTVVAHVCSSFWVVLVAPCRVTGIGVGEYVRHVIVPPLGVGVGTAAILAALWPEFRVVKSSLDVLLGGVGIVALYGVLYLGCGVSSAERVMCLSLLRRAWGRIGVWARG